MPDVARALGALLAIGKARRDPPARVLESRVLAAGSYQPVAIASAGGHSNVPQTAAFALR